MTTPSMDLLFEIGTEELPSGEVDNAVRSLAESIQQSCQNARLALQSIETYATPRRLALIVRGIAAKAEDQSELALGPSVQVAFDADGNPTKAAIGFAKGKGLDLSALQRIQTEKGEYIGVQIHDQGRPAAELLPSILEKSIVSIPWKKSMHWGWSKVAFGRPIKWMVALYGNDVIPVEFGGITAGNQSYGHRFLAPQAIPLNHADEYVDALRNAFVVASADERRNTIRKEVSAIAQKEGLNAIIDEDLVSEIVHLVEWPVALIGHFDAALLEVPREVLIVSMRTHQRYFPAETQDGKLANAFIFVSNMVVDDPDVIVRGNQRVLRARLEDARFFWKEDRKRTLSDFRDNLENIRYIEGLGNIRDRSERIKKTAVALVQQYAPNNEALSIHAARAAQLCKSDLATAMVGEFGELQGIMGRYYAIEDGEVDAVSTAIGEHYMPRGSNDQTPASEAGAFVALADKFEAIVGCFALGLKPSGSADPYALRRAAIGLLRIAFDRKLSLDLESIAQQVYALLPEGKIRPQDEVVAEVNHFIRERIRMLLPDVPTDIAQAVIRSLGNDISSARERANVLQNLQENANFDALAAGFKRVVNIVSKAEQDNAEFAKKVANQSLNVDASLLALDAEKQLAQAVQSADADVQKALQQGDFQAMAQTLIALKTPIDAFFEQVLVNDENPSVRENRLALLASLRRIFLRFADISLVQTNS